MNVGDSRVYRLSSQGEWQQLSRDHTVLNGMIARGEAEEGEEYATVYNTLNQFVSAGLMKRITLDTDRTYFDTNISDHHHLFFEENGVLHDIPGDTVKVEGLPPIPHGSKVRAIEVIVRMTGDKKGR